MREVNPRNGAPVEAAGPQHSQHFIGPMTAWCWSAFTALWRWCHDLIVTFRPCRFSVLVVAINGVILIGVPQCQEALRGLAERNELPELRFQQWLWFFVAAVLLAVNAWYWARQMLNIQFPSTPESTPRRERMRSYLPRICGVATLLLVTIALWTAGRAYDMEEVDAIAPRGIMNVATTVAALLTIAFVAFVQLRQRVFKVATKIKVQSVKELPRGTWWLLIASGAFAFALFL